MKTNLIPFKDNIKGIIGILICLVIIMSFVHFAKFYSDTREYSIDDFHRLRINGSNELEFCLPFPYSQLFECSAYSQFFEFKECFPVKFIDERWYFKNVCGKWKLIPPEKEIGALYNEKFSDKRTSAK